MRRATTEISVEVHAEDDGYVLTVRDNGSGFREGRPVRTGGKGIRSMKKVAALLGGMLALKSAPGEGTEIRLTLPVSTGKRGRAYVSGRG